MHGFTHAVQFELNRGCDAIVSFLIIVRIGRNAGDFRGQTLAGGACEWLRAGKARRSARHDGSDGRSAFVANRGFWTISAVAAVLLFEVAAESPADTETAAIPQAPEVNSCLLLTDRQVSGVLNMKVDPGVREDSGRLDGAGYEGSYSSTCTWRVSADRDAHDPTRPLGGASFAILTIISWPAANNGPANFLQSFRDAAQAHVITTTPVPLQIGDDALWWGDGVAARKGKFSFGISIHLLDGRSKERRMEELLAAKIAAQL